jgi:hypothetical protein
MHLLNINADKDFFLAQTRERHSFNSKTDDISIETNFPFLDVKLLQPGTIVKLGD